MPLLRLENARTFTAYIIIGVVSFARFFARLDPVDDERRSSDRDNNKQQDDEGHRNHGRRLVGNLRYTTSLCPLPTLQYTLFLIYIGLMLTPDKDFLIIGSH